LKLNNVNIHTPYGKDVMARALNAYMAEQSEIEKNKNK
jgi:hypothetical protein